MDSKSNLLEVVMAFFGYSFIGKNLVHGKLMQISVILMNIILFVQNAMFVLTHASLDSASAQAFFGVMTAIQGFFKTTSVYSKYEEIKELKSQIVTVSEEITLKHRLMFAKDFERLRRIVHTMFYITFVSCIMFYIVAPLANTLIPFIKGEKVPKFFTFNHWFPFNPYDHYVSVRIYNLTITMLTYNCTISVEGFIILTFGHLSVLFKCLAEDIVEVVNDYDEKKDKLAEKNLKKKISIHAKLIEIMKKMAEIYEFAFLAHTLGFVISFCFILLKAFVVDSGSDVVASTISVFNMSLYFYYICYFGEKVVEGVSLLNLNNLVLSLNFYLFIALLSFLQTLQLSDRIAETNYDRLNPKLKKYLLLIILRSQRPQHLRAWKFLKLKLTGFTWFMRLSYSLFTALRHLINVEKM